MDVEELIGVNTFRTADNVCGVIRMHKANLGLELQDIIKGAKHMHFKGIDNPTFAKTLFEYLLKYEDQEEYFIANLLHHIKRGLDDMKALMEAVNYMEESNCIKQ